VRPVTSLEVVAVAFGIVSVYLSVKERIASWPTAIVNVLLYFLIFREQKLYAAMGLQLVYAGISAYGWYNWLFGGARQTRLKVSRTPRPEGLLLAVLGVSFALGMGTLLSRHTDDALPYVDSALTAGSLCAMWMMSRKYLENWALWILLDVAYMTLFLSRGLHLTTFLYAVFLILAARGHVEWSRSWRTARAEGADGASDHVGAQG